MADGLIDKCPAAYGRSIRGSLAPTLTQPAPDSRDHRAVDRASAFSTNEKVEWNVNVLAKSPGEICQVHKVNYITHPLKSRGRERETDPKSVFWKQCPLLVLLN